MISIPLSNRHRFGWDHPRIISLNIFALAAPGVVRVYRLPVMESQPQFWAQQEVQTEPPSPPSSTEQGIHKPNALAEKFRQLIKENYVPSVSSLQHILNCDIQVKTRCIDVMSA
jgi:hypothetical protein